jgi:hypothetical protein
MFSRSFELIVFSYALVHFCITAISGSVNSRGVSGAFLALVTAALASGGGAVGVDMEGEKREKNQEHIKGSNRLFPTLAMHDGSLCTVHPDECVSSKSAEFVASKSA